MSDQYWEFFHFQKQDPSCERKELYCEIFELGQCEVALTQANSILYGIETFNSSCFIEPTDSTNTTINTQDIINEKTPGKGLFGYEYHI